MRKQRHFKHVQSRKRITSSLDQVVMYVVANISTG